MLPARIRSIVLELADISGEARQLSARLLSHSRSAVSAEEMPAEDLESLRSKVAELSEQVRNLKLALNEIPDAKFTDEELSMFKASFEQSLKEQSLPTLSQVYSSEYFRDKPKNVRVVVATSLVNEFNRRGGTPSDIWTTIIAKNGAI